MFPMNCNSEHKPVLNPPEYNHSEFLIVLYTFCLYGLVRESVWGGGVCWGCRLVIWGKLINVA